MVEDIPQVRELDDRAAYRRDLRGDEGRTEGTMGEERGLVRLEAGLEGGDVVGFGDGGGDEGPAGVGDGGGVGLVSVLVRVFAWVRVRTALQRRSSIGKEPSLPRLWEMLSLAKGQTQERGPGRDRCAAKDMVGGGLRWTKTVESRKDEG